MGWGKENQGSMIERERRERGRIEKESRERRKGVEKENWDLVNRVEKKKNLVKVGSRMGGGSFCVDKSWLKRLVGDKTSAFRNG